MAGPARSTASPWRCSTDGSRDFYRELGWQVIQGQRDADRVVRSHDAALRSLRNGAVDDPGASFVGALRGLGANENSTTWRRSAPW